MATLLQEFGPRDWALVDKGVVLGKSDALRQVVRDYLLEVRISEEEQERRLQDFLREQELYRERKVYKLRAPGIFGTIRFLHPEPKYFFGVRSTIPEHPQIQSDLWAWVTWPKQTAKSVPLSALGLVQPSGGIVKE